MSLAEQNYQFWLNHPQLSPEARISLEALGRTPQQVEEAFYQDLQFGTAGLRGILGYGSNRMNVYTVARAAEGYARYLEKQGENARDRGIAISYDSRHGSLEFARLSARIFVSHGIRVRLADELRPVPYLSFAIRHFHCAGGVMVTASHNPREYNGYKVYDADGGQLTPEHAAAVAAEMAELRDPIAYYAALPAEDAMQASPLWTEMGADLDEAYDTQALTLSINPEAVQRHADLEIIYTPLHGAGNKPVRRILRKLGFNNVTVVPEQELPNGDFPTAPYPNPEYREALELGIRLAEKRHADLLIATDPDSDRTGVAVRSASGDFVVLSGNQIGILLMDYILSAKKERGELLPHSFCVSTVVSSRLPDRICAAYDVDLLRTLTGFKFIAEQIQKHDEEGDGHFLFGYEESFGYLAGQNVRDKDAVIASMLIAEMAAVSAEQNETLYERLQRIFQTYGYTAERTISLVREGKSGLEKIAAAMRAVRSRKETFFGSLPVHRIDDFDARQSLDPQTGETTALAYDRSNVLVYLLDGIDWFACRPSGTEPKLKIYMGTCRDDPAEAEAALEKLEKAVAGPIEAVLDGE